jgi:DNA-binding CsgD family transcriptional regulator
MVQMVPMLMWETDSRLSVSYLNQSAGRGLGVAVGDNLRALLKPADRQTLDELLPRLAQAGDVGHPGIRVTGASGTLTYLVVQLTAIRLPRDGALGLRWHAFDPLPMALDTALPDRSFFDTYGLSDREREIVVLLVQGFRNREIADRFSIAESTVKGHVSHIFDKFGVDNRSGLMDALERHQIERHGRGPYLLMLLNRLLADS